MMKQFFLIVLSAAFTGCASHAALTGEDRDAHGCIPSAGYTWSSVSGRCVRLWEEGISLLPARTDDRTSLAAYVILSEDGTQAEVFASGMRGGSSVLSRAFTPDGPYWTAGQSGCLLRRLPQGWELQRGAELLYSAPNPTQD